MFVQQFIEVWMYCIEVMGRFLIVSYDVPARLLLTLCVCSMYISVVHLVPWLKEPHTHYSTSLYAAKLCSSQNWFHHKQHWVAQRPSFAVLLHGTQSSASEKSTLQMEGEMERGKTWFINEPASKTLKRGSQLSCHKLKASHFQSPKFLIKGWVYSYFACFSHSSHSRKRIFRCRGQER